MLVNANELGCNVSTNLQVQSLCHFQTAVHLVFNSTETSEHLNNKAIITTGGEASTSYVIFRIELQEKYLPNALWILRTGQVLCEN